MENQIIEPSINNQIHIPVPPNENQLSIGTVQHNYWKWISITFFILLVLTIIAFGYYLTKEKNKTDSVVTTTITPTAPAPIIPTIVDETKNWKTAANSTYGFKIKYPTNKFTDCNSTLGDGIRLWDMPFDCPTAHDIFYSIGLIVYKPGEYKSDRVPVSTENIVVGNIHATKQVYKYTVDDGPLFPQKETTEVIVPMPTFILLIQLLGDSPEKKKLFDQILGTVIFSTSPESMQSFKTYTNSFIGYSIEYPSDWTPVMEQKTEPFKESKLRISKGSYALQINTTEAGSGGVVCQFDDTTRDPMPGPALDTLGSFFTMKLVLEQEARRNLNPISQLVQYGEQKTSMDYTYRVCSKLSSAIKYTDNKPSYIGNFNLKSSGEILYYTPKENIDPVSLTILDNMAASIKVL